MNRLKFEKFEMKYGYFFPDEFKNFLYKYGGDSQFGSCRFEYADNIINNLLRRPGEMDFHLIPFGDVGNGDYYCFYRYGVQKDDYFIGIWLHETRNFVVLTSNFKSFMYKCLLDDYLSTVIPSEELSEDESTYSTEESIERCRILSEEFEFDFSKVKNMKNEFDYHRLMAEYDERAVQSLCYMGKNLLKTKDINGFKFLDSAIDTLPCYTAPYYIAGRALLNMDKDAGHYFTKGLRTSLVMTGYSYWEEDYLEIPEDVHREIALYSDGYLKECTDYLEKNIFKGRDPYDIEVRVGSARDSIKKMNYAHAVIEYSNALFCCDENEDFREVLKIALKDIKDAGLYHLTGIIEHDIRALR